MIQFSVLICVYNRDIPAFFRRALDSVYTEQILKPSEIVLVVDGFVNDEIIKVISDFSSYAPCNVIQLDKNVGLGKALQIGVLNCKYDYIARMDSDDISLPNRFNSQISFLENNPEVDVLGGFLEEFDNDTNKIISIRKVPIEHSDCVKFLKFGCPFNHPTVVFKKSTVLISGNYRDFFLKEDLFLWLNIYINGFKFHNLDSVVLSYRLSKNFFNKRRGPKYALSEFRIFYYRYKIGFIGIIDLVFVGLPISFVRILPGFLVKFIYTKFIRRNSLA